MKIFFVFYETTSRHVEVYATFMWSNKTTAEDDFKMWYLTSELDQLHLKGIVKKIQTIQALDFMVQGLTMADSDFLTIWPIISLLVSF